MTQQSQALDDIWDAATNSVCQHMQETDMCKCPDGDCLAEKIRPGPEDRAHFAALSQHPVAATVKPLDWLNIDGDFVARTDIKSYCCRRFGDGFDLLIDGHHTKPYIAGFRETHPTIDAAKAAAQADYETRIRSALYASPVPGKADGGVTEATDEMVKAFAVAALMGGDGEFVSSDFRMQQILNSTKRRIQDGLRAAFAAATNGRAGS